MSEQDKNQAYLLQLLEEIRTLLGQQLQVSARIYDDIAGQEDEQTWKQSMKDIEDGRERLEALRQSLDGNSRAATQTDDHAVLYKGA